MCCRQFKCVEAVVYALATGIKNKEEGKRKGPLTLVSWGTTGVRHVTNE